MTDPVLNGDAVQRFYRLLASTTSVRVVEGSTLASKRKNDKTLFVENDSVAIAALTDALRLRPLGAGLAFMTPGNPTLALSGDDGLLATVQYLGGDTDIIRSDALPEDAVLENPHGLSDWLSAHRIDGPGATPA